MKLQVSAPCYNEIAQALKRIGRDINDGVSPLTINKDDAIFPPYDFRMVAVRQNCLMAAAEVFKNSALDTQEEFINICNHIFNWVLNEEKIDNTNVTVTVETSAKEWK